MHSLYNREIMSTYDCYVRQNLLPCLFSTRKSCEESNNAKKTTAITKYRYSNQVKKGYELQPNLEKCENGTVSFLSYRSYSWQTDNANIVKQWLREIRTKSSIN